MKDNVIDLESRRVQNQNTPDNEKLKVLKMKADLENIKLILSTSLASVLVLVTIANSNLLTSESQTETAKSGRGVASAQTGTSAWEDRLAEKLAVTSLKQEASLGRAPSSTEQFTFGALEGKYAVRFENGKVREFEFANPQSDQKPIVVRDRAEFLKSHRSVLPISFDKIERGEVTTQDLHTFERYNLIENGHSVGSVEFRLDEANHVLSMRYLDSRLAAN